MSGVECKSEQRGRISVSFYEVEITAEMRQTALNFATDIILGRNQFPRLLPNVLRNSGDLDNIQKIEIQRTYIGKLGEMVFSKLLDEMGKEHDVQDMFKIWEGQHNVDSFDFITRDGETVDVKTGFRSNHTRLMVNEEQFNNIPKKYYVGVKLNAQDINREIKLVDWESITLGIVQGYAEHRYMEENLQPIDYGEGIARALSYSFLMGINRLLSKF